MKRNDFIIWFENTYPDWILETIQKSTRLGLGTLVTMIYYRGVPVFYADDWGLRLNEDGTFYESIMCNKSWRQIFQENRWDDCILFSGDLCDHKSVIEKFMKLYHEHLEMAKKAPAIAQKNETLSVLAGAIGETKEQIDKRLAGDKKVVEIIWDSNKCKLRASHNGIWCKFPNKYRIKGAKYMVDELVLKRGCYEVKGEIKLLGDQ